MNVRTKLLILQSFNVVAIVGVALVAVAIAQRFDYHVRRAEFAYSERQTITILALRAAQYRMAVGDALLPATNRGGELELARRNIRDTMEQLVTQAKQEMAFLTAEERAEEQEEAERLERLERVLADIDRSVDRMITLRDAGSDAEARRLQQLIAQRFEGEIAELVAAAMADEQEEVEKTRAQIAELAARRVVFLIASGGLALIISVAMGLLIYRSISRPMRELMTGVRALRAGSLQHRVAWRGRDEFAELAAQFNDMAASIEDREQRRHESQSDLEQQVKLRTRELEAANHRLKYLDRRRLQFLAEISHELRTPVTVLRGEADVTLRAHSASSEMYRDALARISQQAEQMGRLIDDLLFLVRSEADTIAFDRQRIDLREVVADAVRDGTVLAQGRRITIAAALPERPVWVNADAQRLRQAVLIAIDNAIKYSSSESAVEVSLTAGNGRATITVLDHGAGVPPEDLPYVFERFYRIGGRAKQRPDGSGLGLPIAKWITEKHDGTISLSSTPGQATTLTITLPRLGADAP